MLVETTPLGLNTSKCIQLFGTLPKGLTFDWKFGLVRLMSKNWSKPQPEVHNNSQVPVDFVEVSGLRLFWGYDFFD